ALPHPAPASSLVPYTTLFRSEVKIAVDVGSANEAVARRFAPNATIKSLKSRDEVMLEMSSGRVDCVVNALVLGLTAIAKNPNLRSEEHTSELQSRENLVCRLL